ncbi:conserved hypothetical protein [Denitrovibrio acetiphilus DSM 12809]|uniref:Uncharacterized protein n=1 Tax=Denitrovibrio acetiphilus (strain DSM 12809 / NBRC 114555 / N2460) TaxID=522772 RepID=D4H2X1_DENA2|nr:hypothetical protein [Denitrovibrio acetiphilus]ADD68994.1 conserved hypothetical protein [Denitrovibrio acetiphilus DSM 12809]
MKLELAKAGNHNGITITEKDLKEMQENFSNDVPVTIGHELDDTMPAYGWVKALKLSEDGQTLIGTVELNEELEQSVAEGRYKNWSIGAGSTEEGGMYLHHVAFLGAVPPMIKDLKIIELGDKSKIFTFSMKHGKCSFTLSDKELAEFNTLKKQKHEATVKKLSDATAGKLPFGKREELISFADNQLSAGREDIVEMLISAFASVKKPVSPGLSESINSAKSRITENVFSKI